MRGDLVGIAEAATVLGVGRAAASRRVQTDGFPQPVLVLQQGPLWAGREIVEWHRKTTTLPFHSQLSPYGPIPSQYARSILAIRITIEAQRGRQMEKRLAYCSVGDASERLLGLDLLQCLEWMESPVWDQPAAYGPGDHWGQIPATPKARWRKTAELSIGVGTAPGLPNSFLVGHVGTDADWNEDAWAQAFFIGRNMIEEAGKRGNRVLKTFYSGAAAAAMRDESDHATFLVGGAGEPYAVSMPSEDDIVNHAWGRED